MDKDFKPSNWYSDYYSLINASANPNSLAFKFLHRSLERYCPVGNYPEILEIGANNGEHISFVPPGWNNYTAVDLRVPEDEICNEFQLVRVHFVKADVQDLPFPDFTFDRIIVTCVLHHVVDLEQALREILRVTKFGGIISIAVPHDPGFVYRFLRYLTSVRRARKLSLEGELNLVHALEHRNHFLGIETILKWINISQEIEIHRSPNIMKFWQFNVLTNYYIRKVT